MANVVANHARAEFIQLLNPMLVTCRPAANYFYLSTGQWYAQAMPLFDFICSACNQSFEAILNSTETEQDIQCPHCEQDDVRKALCAPSQIRSGSGKAHSHDCWTKSIGNRAAAAKVKGWKKDGCC